MIYYIIISKQENRMSIAVTKEELSDYLNSICTPMLAQAKAVSDWTFAIRVATLHTKATIDPSTSFLSSLSVTAHCFANKLIQDIKIFAKSVPKEEKEMAHWNECHTSLKKRFVKMNQLFVEVLKLNESCSLDGFSKAKDYYTAEFMKKVQEISEEKSLSSK